MIAGFSQSFISCPMDLVKIRVQHQGIGEKRKPRSLKSMVFASPSLNNEPPEGL